ncbi:sulfite exporter TauE/SafE family protein [Streptomyces sp. 3211]|uniref:sulfite exporter TauE/SafE family protein n=1 Tax=Streptomyces sp. 3211 TaxID=1964449 RepID=UPI0017CF0D83|nr:sulfite exporter TauE/SafE family protein [Streptomyces sp. 3211]
MRTEPTLDCLRPTHRTPVVFAAGAAIGVLGGMIGLGGAEFRLPLLIGLFGFAALSAVILSKAMSLVVVLVALPARPAAVPAGEVAASWPVAANLLGGSLLGAWAGASWAVRMRTATLYEVLSALMVLMAAALVLTPPPRSARSTCRCGHRSPQVSRPGSVSAWSQRSWPLLVGNC